MGIWECGALALDQPHLATLLQLRLRQLGGSGNQKKLPGAAEALDCSGKQYDKHWRGTAEALNSHSRNHITQQQSNNSQGAHRVGGGCMEGLGGGINKE